MNTDAHCTACVEIFNSEKTNYPEIDEKIIHAVQSHGCDELTGLIFACAMARPSKSVCNREVIKEGAAMMGEDLNQVIQDCILAMKTKHEELGV